MDVSQRTNRLYALIAVVILLVVGSVIGYRHFAREDDSWARPAIALSAPPELKLESLPVQTLFSIDIASQKNNTVVANPTHIDVAVDAALATNVSGWAVDAPAKSLASTIYVVVDGTKWYKASYPFGKRPDVATALRDPDFVAAGFQGTIPSGTLAPGRHAIAIAIVDRAGTGYYTGSSYATLVVSS